MASRNACSVTKSCLTLCDPMDCAFVHGILQMRTLEWVVVLFPCDPKKNLLQICAYPLWVFVPWSVTAVLTVTVPQPRDEVYVLTRPFSCKWTKYISMVLYCQEAQASPTANHLTTLSISRVLGGWVSVQNTAACFWSDQFPLSDLFPKPHPNLWSSSYCWPFSTRVLPTSPALASLLPWSPAVVARLDSAEGPARSSDLGSPSSLLCSWQTVPEDCLRKTQQHFPQRPGPVFQEDLPEGAFKW